MNNEKYVIGINGQTGAGKSTAIQSLIKQYPNAVYIESRDIYIPLTYLYVSMEKKGFNIVDIEEYISKYFKIDYFIKSQKVYFKYFIPQCDVKKNEFDLISKAYEVDQNPNISKSIVKKMKTIVDELKQSNTVIIVGRHVERTYNNLDYHFTFEADYDLRIKRIMERDNVSYKYAVRRDAEDNLEKYKDTVTINTTNLSKKDVKQQIKNILSTKNYRKKKVKVLFVGAACTGKTEICKALSKKFKEPYINESAREYMELHDLHPGELDENHFIKANKMQMANINKKLKVTNRYLFIDSCAIVCINFFTSEETLEIIRKQIEMADIIFVCDNDIPYIYDTRRSDDVQLAIDAQKQIIKFLKTNEVPYIMLHGDVKERVETVEEILNKYSCK